MPPRTRPWAGVSTVDREQTEVLFAEAQRLRAHLIEASVKLSTFTQQLRDLLDLNETGTDDEEDQDER